MTVDKFEGLLELAEAPFLEGDRLVLGPLRAAHAEEMVVALATRAWTGTRAARRRPWVSSAPATNGRQRGWSPAGEERWSNWVGRERGGEAVGYVQATVRRGREAVVAELAWVIAAPYQGRGLARARPG